MKLSEVLELIRIDDNEIDLKVCYNNEFGEECTLCKTFVPQKKYKEGNMYWSDAITYEYVFPTDKLERYKDFEVGMLLAEGKKHFFIFASNFK